MGIRLEELIHRCLNGATRYVEDIASERKRTPGTETSKYREEEKINNDFLSSGERKGKSPNRIGYGQFGVVGLHLVEVNQRELSGKAGDKG